MALPWWGTYWPDSPEPAGIGPLMTALGLPTWAPQGPQTLSSDELEWQQIAAAWEADEQYRLLQEYLELYGSLPTYSTPPRSTPDEPGTVIPRPYARLDTTASFPAGASAQTPIVAGSRAHFLYGADGTLDGRVKQGDPFGFVVPIRADARRDARVRATIAGRAGRRALGSRAHVASVRSVGRSAARLRPDSRSGVAGGLGGP